MLTRAKYHRWEHWGCGAYSKAALINFFVPDAALIWGRRLIEGGAYSSKYGARLCPPVCLQVFPSITKLSFFYKLLFPSLDFDLWGHFSIQVADFLRKVSFFAKETTPPANEAHHLWAAD